MDIEDAIWRFDAGRWSASSFNEQPWSWLVARREEAAAYERLLSALIPFNQGWASHAPVLAVSLARTTFARNGQPNRHAGHDVGQAAAQIALDGNAAAGAHFFLISNPTRTSGAFYESQQPGGDYTPLHISSEQSPNITGESRIPGLATREWRDKMVAKYGADSLWVAVRVRGEFPSGADDEVFGAGLVSAGMHRVAEIGDTEPLVCGLDVAGFGGDENILAPRRGPRTLPMVQIPAGESVDIAAAAIRAARKLRRDANERVQINVDANGVGAGVYSVLVSDAFEHDGERFVPRDEIIAVAVMTVEPGATAVIKPLPLIVALPPSIASTSNFDNVHRYSSSGSPMP